MSAAVLSCFSGCLLIADHFEAWIRAVPPSPRCPAADGLANDGGLSIAGGDEEEDSEQVRDSADGRLLLGATERDTEPLAPTRELIINPRPLAVAARRCLRGT